MKEMDKMPRQEGRTAFSPGNYDIVFDNVDFSYQDGVQTLKNVSFTANQGEVTALVGPSGSGKSTMARLSARFWDIDEGVITLGGEDVSRIDPETLLHNFSIVFQDVTLFNSSVRENIRLGRKDATDEEVMKAARLAQCDEFVKILPQGYDTLIGENGERLSGGERQRISIARAILKDAPIILLDEATASLDAENENKIQSALSELIKNKTVLIIAHRMRTVLGADKIVVIKDGEIEETGTPLELKEHQGLFSSMLKTQFQNN
jgi:ATP-binding cassette subfamily B protein